MRKARPLVMLAAALLNPLLPGQSITGNATSHGPCSISNTGNSNVINLTSCGIGAEQGNKIIGLLQKLLALPNSATMDAKLDELIAVASRPVTCSATILHNEGNIGTANLQGSQVVCDPGTPLTMNFLHVTGPGEQGQTTTPPPSPGALEHFAMYIPQLVIDHGRVISAPGTLMTSNQWTLLYTMLQQPQYANNVEFPISVFEDEMLSTVSRSPSSCRAEMDEAESRIRANLGHETETIAVLRAKPTTCVFMPQ
jgi:hypothetical protein